MDQERFERSKELLEQVASTRLNASADLPLEFEITREFCREMSEPWQIGKDTLRPDNVESWAIPMVAELEYKTTLALARLEERLLAIEESMREP